MARMLPTRVYSGELFHTDERLRPITQRYPVATGMGAYFGTLGFMAASLLNEDLFTVTNGLISAALVAGVFGIKERIRRSRSQNQGTARMTESVNNSILEITGGTNQGLTEQQVLAVMQGKSVETISVNGVPGVEVSAVDAPVLGKDGDQTVAFNYKEPDNGIESFDRLVAAAAQKNPEIQSVIGAYRGNS